MHNNHLVAVSPSTPPPQPPSVITVCVIICSLHNSPVISFGDRHQLLVLAGQAVFLQLPCVVGCLSRRWSSGGKTSQIE